METAREPDPSVGHRPTRVELGLARVALAPWRWITSPRLSGLEHLPTDRPALLVGNHSTWAVLDAPLLLLELYASRGIFPRAVGDHLHFQLPGWRTVIGRAGVVDGTRETVRALMRAREWIVLFPGGAREVFKRRGEKYALMWGERAGFARLAIEFGYPIVPLSLVGAEDMYDIVLDADDLLASPLGPLLRRVAPRPDVVPPVVRGLGPTVIPRAERFYFHFGEPVETRHLTGRARDHQTCFAVRERVREAVEAGIARLLLERERDPDRALVARLLAPHGGAEEAEPPPGDIAPGGPVAVTTGVPVDPRALVPRLLLAYAGFLARYHQHRIHHLERLDHLLRAGRRVVLVGNHVLDLADPLLFVAALVRRYRRTPHFIGHENIIFHVPGLRELATGWGVIPSRHMAEAGDALERDGLLMLFPGSVTEAGMRRFRDEPYRLKWEDRKGFLQLALAHDAEVVFVAAVGSEEMYYQSRIPTPDWILALANAGDPRRYHGAPLTFGLLGPHLLPATFPLPVQLTHDVSSPLDLGDRAAARRDPAALDALHARVWAECQAFLDAAVAGRERGAPCTDRVIRGAERVLHAVGV